MVTERPRPGRYLVTPLFASSAGAWIVTALAHVPREVALFLRLQSPLGVEQSPHLLLRPPTLNDTVPTQHTLRATSRTSAVLMGGAAYRLRLPAAGAQTGVMVPFCTRSVCWVNLPCSSSADRSE